MRKWAWVAACLVSNMAWAGCDAITDPDEKYYCFARADRSTSLCQAIKDADTQMSCYAEVGRDPDLCRRVRDGMKKEKCKRYVARAMASPASEPVPQPRSPHGGAESAASGSDAQHDGGGRGTKFQFDLFAPTGCASVTDMNQKYLCFGLMERSEEHCYPINHADFRYLCTAALRSEHNYCVNIRELSLRQTCEKLAKG